MDPDKDTLLQAVTALPTVPAERPETTALVRQALAEPVVQTYLEVISAPLVLETEQPLAEYLRLALIGIAATFAERNLSPYVAEHVAIVEPLLDDIRTVYAQIQAQHVAYDHEEFRYRAYDYGVHKAHYLDWRLYLSKEMY
jgi:hypothetical protein